MKKELIEFLAQVVEVVVEIQEILMLVAQRSKKRFIRPLVVRPGINHSPLHHPLAPLDSTRPNPIG